MIANMGFFSIFPSIFHYFWSCGHVVIFFLVLRPDRILGSLIRGRGTCPHPHPPAPSKKPMAIYESYKWVGEVLSSVFLPLILNITSLSTLSCLQLMSSFFSSDDSLISFFSFSLWSRKANIPDESTGPRTHLFACSPAPFIHLHARQHLLAPLLLFVRSLAHLITLVLVGE